MASLTGDVTELVDSVKSGKVRYDDLSDEGKLVYDVGTGRHKPEDLSEEGRKIVGLGQSTPFLQRARSALDRAPQAVSPTAQSLFPPKTPVFPGRTLGEAARGAGALGATALGVAGLPYTAASEGIKAALPVERTGILSQTPMFPGALIGRKRPVTMLGARDFVANAAPLLVGLRGMKGAPKPTPPPAPPALTERAVRPWGRKFTSPALGEEMMVSQRTARPPVLAGPPAVPGRAAVGPQPGEASQYVGSMIGKRGQRKMPLRDQWDDFYQNYLNRFHGVEKIANIARKDMPLAPGEDPKLLSRSYLGVAGKANAFARWGTFRTTLAGNIEKTGPSFEEIIGPVRNNLDDLNKYLVAKRTIEYTRRGLTSGLDPRKAIVASEELARKNPALSQVGERLQKWNDSLLEYLEGSGRISAGELSKIKEKNPFYAPMKRILDGEPASSFAPRAKDVFTKVGKPIKRVVGTGGKTMKVSDPVEEMLDNAYHIIEAADRNRVARSIVGLRETSPLVKDLMIPTKRSQGPGILTAYVDGKPKHFEVPELLAKSVQGMATVDDPGLNVFRAATGLLRVGATETPEFGVRNTVRDQISAMINARYGFVPIVDWTRGLFNLAAKDDVYWKWQASGSAQSFLVSMDRAIKDIRYTPRTSFPNPLNVLRNLSEMSEKPTRLGVFSRARRAGASDLEAAFESREATTDFARRGLRMRAINNLYAFFNARLQGIDKLARTTIENPVKTGLTAAPLVSASVYLWMHNRGLKEYQRIPQEKKDKYWHIPYEKKEGGYGFVPLPKGDVMEIFGSTTEHALEYLATNEKDALLKFAGRLLNDVSPMDFSTGGAVPTLLRPSVEAVANYNFYGGRPIVSRGMQRYTPEMQQRESTSPLAARMGEALNVSPLKVEHFIYGHTAGLGRLGMRALDVAGTKAGLFPEKARYPTKLSEEPFFRVFVEREAIGAASEPVNKFYEEGHKLGMLDATYRDFPQKRESIQKNHPEYRLNEHFQRINQAFASHRDRISNIVKSGLPDAQKRVQIDYINRHMTTMAEEALEKLEQSRKGVPND